ncbi:major facilitator superfamily domain-containing protein [Obelidium mucronatum]|nr:major facilitator superfamily domain-containing protein [Obelidium mucronatum]
MSTEVRESEIKFKNKWRMLRSPPETPPRDNPSETPLEFDIESDQSEASSGNQELNHVNPNSIWENFNWKSPFLIIPPMFIHQLGASMGGSAFSQFLILTVCKQLGDSDDARAAGAWPKLGLSETNLNTTHNLEYERNYFWNQTLLFSESGNGLPDYKTCASRNKVVSQTAAWSQIIGLVSSVPAFLLLPLMGRLVDRLGRRTMVIVPILAAILDSIFVLGVAFADMSLWFLVVSNLIQGFMGGYGVLMMAGYAFIADTSTPANRTQTLLIMDVVSFIAFTLGPFLGGMLYRKTGLITVYIITLSLDVMALLYFYFVLPETLKQTNGPLAQSTNRRPSRSSSSNIEAIIDEPIAPLLWNHFLKSWAGSLDILSTPGRGNSLLILALVQALSGMAAAGYEFSFFLYPAQRFGWDAYDYGVYSMAKSFCRLFYLSLVLPALLRSIGKASNLVVKTRYELGIIRYGYFMFCFGLICHGLASEGWMFYPLMLFYTGGSIAGPTIRGISSRSVPESSQGSLFAAFGLLQYGTSLISEVFIPFVYRGLVSINKPEYMFFVQASFWAMALFLSAYLKESRTCWDCGKCRANRRGPTLSASSCKSTRYAWY